MQTIDTESRLRDSGNANHQSEGEIKMTNEDIKQAILLAERIEKGLPPRNAQEAKDMEEAKALMALCEAFVTAPKGTTGDQIRGDAVKAAHLRIFHKQN